MWEAAGFGVLLIVLIGALVWASMPIPSPPLFDEEQLWPPHPLDGVQPSRRRRPF